MFQGGAVAMVVAAMPYKCPGAPHEAAMLLDHFFRRRGMRDRVKIHLYTPESQPMPVAGPVLGEAVMALLEAKGIGFHPSCRLERLNRETKELSFTNGVSAPYDLLVAIPPHRCPTVLKEAGLTDETGWVPVERSTLSTRWPGVYAIGDATAISMPGRWKPEVPLTLPKAGVFAHAQANVVAERIAAAISGTGSEATFDGEGMCIVETGEGRAAIAHGNFYAEPNPTIQLRPPSTTWHVAKVVFEKWWLSRPGVRRALLEFAIRRAGKFFGFPAV
jgi:sulfide:quinone oxidoreductase